MYGSKKFKKNSRKFYKFFLGCQKVRFKFLDPKIFGCQKILNIRWFLLSVAWQCVHYVCFQIKKKFFLIHPTFNSNKKNMLLAPDLYITFF